MNIDSTTNLQVHSIPPALQQSFPELSSSLIHWYGSVEKLNSQKKSQTRMLFVTSQAVYVCLPQGGITRCVQLSSVVEVIVSGSSTITLRMAPPNHDLAFSVSSPPTKDTIVHILRRLHFAAKGFEMPLRVVPDSDQGNFSGVEAPMMSLPSSSALTSSAIDNANVLAVQQEALHVKYRDAMCDMVKDVAQLLQSIQTKDQQIEDMRNQLEGLRQEVGPLRETARVLLDAQSKIEILEKEAEAQKGLIHHLQQQRVRSGTKDHTAEISVLRHELEEARAQIGTLRAVSLDQNSISEAQSTLRQLSDEYDQVRAQLRRKEVELQERESQLREAETTSRNVAATHQRELARIRSQFVEYDERIMSFIQKAFDARGSAENGTQTAVAAAGVPQLGAGISQLGANWQRPIRVDDGLSPRLLPQLSSNSFQHAPIPQKMNAVTIPSTHTAPSVSPHTSTGRQRDRSIL
eukprot:PhF_6_TR13595/c0_g1_i1/m.21752